MKMELPTAITPVMEEVWYLVHNKKFQLAVNKIRAKYNIPLGGVSNVSEWFSEHWRIDNLDNMQSFQKDIIELVSRCRIGKSKHDYELWYAIRQYVLTNKLEAYENGIQVIPLPNIEIYKVQNKVVLTMYLDYDANKKEIDKLIRGSWRKIRKMQKELAGELLEPSKKFADKVALWEEN